MVRVEDVEFWVVVEGGVVVLVNGLVCIFDRWEVRNCWV